MPVDNMQSHEIEDLEDDLERTDRLPVLEGSAFVDDDIEDLEDDAVRMDYVPLVPQVKPPEFPRPSGVDLPSLAESVRSVEERIARQNAEYEALKRNFEKMREAEAAALARGNVLSSELAGVRAMLETEQARARELDKTLAEKNFAAEAARARVEEALREAERHQSEARTLRDTLASRDATIVQVTHSLGERDAQLNALQREHSQIVPELADRSKVSSQLESDLKSERDRATGLGQALKSAQQVAASLKSQLKSEEDQRQSAQRELDLLKTQAATYLDQLRTREWRRGFDLNMFREFDARIGAVQDDRGALQSERDQLRQRVTEMESKIAARDEAIARLQDASGQLEQLRSEHQKQLALVEEARTELMKKIATIDADRNRLNGEIATRDRRIIELQELALDGDAARASHGTKLIESEQARAELSTKIALLDAERSRLQGEIAARDERIARLISAVQVDESDRAKHETALQQIERTCAELNGQISALQGENSRLASEVALRDRALADAQAAGRNEVQRGVEALKAAQSEQGKLTAQIARLQLEMQERERQIAALTQELAVARGPVEPIEAEVKRLTGELAARAASLEQLSDENRSLRGALERARGALEEREFLIRRLERSETNNANVLGRIQTSIERLGSTPAAASAGNAAAPVECKAELIRFDGQHQTAYSLGRRTRIGRAAGCEMQIESSSVSRHHALVLMSTRDVIIEDLNSTNGVLVNGRKVSRQLLNDGDLLTVGEAQFRLSVKLTPRTVDSTPPDSPAAPG